MAIRNFGGSTIRFNEGIIVSGSSTKDNYASGTLYAGKIGIGTTSPVNALSVVGAVSASLGFSGSLTNLIDGSSYLIAGSNITVSSASNGAITISASGGGGGISFDGSTANGVLTYKDSDEATVESNLTFDGTDLILAGNANFSEYIYHSGDTDTFIIT